MSTIKIVVNLPDEPDTFRAVLSDALADVLASLDSVDHESFLDGGNIYVVGKEVGNYRVK